MGSSAVPTAHSGTRSKYSYPSAGMDTTFGSMGPSTLPIHTPASPPTRCRTGSAHGPTRSAFRRSCWKALGSRPTLHLAKVSTTISSGHSATRPASVCMATLSMAGTRPSSRRHSRPRALASTSPMARHPSKTAPSLPPHTLRPLQRLAS